VIVVGRSSPYEKFNRNEELKKKISYESLSKLQSDYELKKTINQVLLAIGTRYAQTNPDKCLKTQALVHKFGQVSKEGGPVSFLKKLSQFRDDNERIQFVIRSFKFIKNKGARDLLMELGIVRETIALDVRMQNIFGKLEIEFPRNISNPKVYDQIEEDILFKVCKPLGISGVELDRMLYQNYDEIMSSTCAWMPNSVGNTIKQKNNRILRIKQTSSNGNNNMLVRNHLLCPYSDCEANKRSKELRIQVLINEVNDERTVGLRKTLKGQKDNTTLPYKWTKEAYDSECPYCQRPVEVVIDETHTGRNISLRQRK
jgi:hypothetical protein